jgi:hypothetical protein
MKCTHLAHPWNTSQHVVVVVCSPGAPHAPHVGPQRALIRGMWWMGSTHAPHQVPPNRGPERVHFTGSGGVQKHEVNALPVTVSQKGVDLGSFGAVPGSLGTTSGPPPDHPKGPS